MLNKFVNILSIETSCDETAAAVLNCDLKSKNPNFSVVSSVVNSQIQQHSKFGGVVPEIAARAHLENITSVVDKALSDASLQLKDINYIAPTTGPGLIASLLVGTEFAKGLAVSTGISMVPTNHMEGHMYSALGRKIGDKLVNVDEIKYPIMALVVSGGHTMLVNIESEKKYKVIGNTIDDAAGEAFDKVARMLKLPYPGGPEISKLATKSAPTKITFPRPLLNKDNFDFSFSGLKTSVLYFLKDNKKFKKAEIALAFEEAVSDVLTQKTLKAAKKFGAKTITLTGGVSANKRLRDSLRSSCEKNNLEFLVPPMELCTDNAAMIGIAAYMNLRKGVKTIKPEEVRADSGWEIY